MNLPICPSCGFNGGGHYHAIGCPLWGSFTSMCGYCHVAIPALGPAAHCPSCPFVVGFGPAPKPEPTERQVAEKKALATRQAARDKASAAKGQAIRDAENGCLEACARADVAYYEELRRIKTKYETAATKAKEKK